MARVRPVEPIRGGAVYSYTRTPPARRAANHVDAISSSGVVRCCRRTLRVDGVREFLHDHAGEQPFTRSLEGVAIPEGVETFTIEARYLVNGWGGATVEVALPPFTP